MGLTLKQVMNKPLRIMLPGNSVKHCDPDATLRKVLSILRKSKIGSVVISQKGKVVGIFTERDYVARVAGKKLDLDKEKVKSYMTTHPVCVQKDEPIGDVLTKMQSGKFRHLLVVNKKRKCEDILSVKDVTVYLVNSMIDELVLNRGK